MDQNNEPPRMVFKDEEFQRATQHFQTPTPKLVQQVIKYSGGYVKDEKQASYVLIGFVITAIIVSLLLIFWGSGSRPDIPDYHHTLYS